MRERERESGAYRLFKEPDVLILLSERGLHAVVPAKETFEGLRADARNVPKSSEPKTPQQGYA